MPRMLVLLASMVLFSNPCTAQSPDSFDIGYSDSTYFIPTPYEFGQVMGVPPGLSNNIQHRVDRSVTPWMFFLLFFCMGLYAFTRYAYRREWDASFRAIRNMNISQQLYRDREITQNFASILLNVNYTMVLSIYVYMLFRMWMPGFVAYKFSMIALILLAVVLILTIRFVSLKGIALIFPISELVDYYTYNLLLINKITGMALLPVLFVIEFGEGVISDVGLLVSFLILAMSVLYKIYRGLIIAGSFIRFQKFHFILYICTLEISPILILVKLLAMNLGEYLV